MLLDQNSHQTVTRFGCIGFSMYACGFSVPQMRQLCLFTYPPRSKRASSEKMLFLAKSASSVSRSQAHLAKRCSCVYTTIFVQRKDKTNYLSNQTWDSQISTSWKKSSMADLYTICHFRENWLFFQNIPEFSIIFNFIYIFTFIGKTLPPLDACQCLIFGIGCATKLLIPWLQWWEAWHGKWQVQYQKTRRRTACAIFTLCTLLRTCLFPFYFCF